MLPGVVVMVTSTTVGAVSAVENMSGYWHYPDSNQALGETVQSVLVSDGIDQWLIGEPIVLAVFVEMFITARRHRREEENATPDMAEGP